jgi:hypothetical protein
MTLRALFAGQRRGHKFSNILAEPALSIEQTYFLKVCPGNKRHETNTISRDGGDKLADDGHATSAFNGRDDAQCVNGKFTATCLPPPTRPRRSDTDTPRSMRIARLQRRERIDEFHLAFRTERASIAG